VCVCVITYFLILKADRNMLLDFRIKGDEQKYFLFVITMCVYIVYYVTILPPRCYSPASTLDFRTPVMSADVSVLVGRGIMSFVRLPFP